MSNKQLEPGEAVVLHLAEEANAEVINKDKILTETEADDDIEKVASNFNLAAADDDLAAALHRRKVMNLLLYLTSFVCLAGGTAQTMLQKWQNLQVVEPFCDGTDPTCTPTYYMGAWWQTELMYLGEHLSLYVYFFIRWWRSTGRTFGQLEVPHSDASLAKPKSPLWWWVIPTMCDMASTVMLNYATQMTRASTVQMLRNFMTVIACVIFIFYLRRPLRYAEWIGAFIVTIGLILTAVYDIGHPETGTNYEGDLAWLGTVLSLAATCFNGFQLVFEESLCRKFWISPMKAVGVEGAFGLVICGLFLIICQYTGLEDVKKGLYDIGHSTNLIIADVTYVIAVLFFNFAGLFVAKLGSAIARSLVFTARSVLVWFIQLPLGWSTYNSLSCAGMLVCVLGILVFYRAIPMPCWPAYGKFMAEPFGCWGWRWKYDVNGDPVDVPIIVPTEEVQQHVMAEKEGYASDLASHERNKSGAFSTSSSSSSS